MEKTSIPRIQRSNMSISTEEKQLVMTPTSYYLNFRVKSTTPVLKPSPSNGGSTLYDSYELKAVTQQLNRIIRCSQASSTTYPSQLKSPFFSFDQRLDQIYKENAKTPKRVSSLRKVNRGMNCRGSSGNTKSFIPRLWKKVKLTFLRSNKQIVNKS